jgi:SAM-dependent methyltransferase
MRDVPGNDYHSYIYDVPHRRIVGDFEAAYAECDDVWPTQHQLDLPHFVYIKGLVRERQKVARRRIRVLDIGCGYGDLVNELNGLPDCQAVGLEISFSALKKGKERFGGLHAAVADANAGLPIAEQAFDLILVLGVFWFLLSRREFCLGELKRVASTHANFVFTVHMPDDPIGKETMSCYDDFLRILRRDFEVLDAFRFYQPAALASEKRLDSVADDILVRCGRKDV